MSAGILSFVVVFVLLLVSRTAEAEPGREEAHHSFIRHYVNRVIDRLKERYSPRQLTELTAADAERIMTPEERHVLGSQYLTFTVTCPVTVWVFHQTERVGEAAWLPDRGFERTSTEIVVGEDDVFTGWKKHFPAGRVGLGYNTLQSWAGYHYFVVPVPLNEDANLQILDISPERHSRGILKHGARTCDEHFREVGEDDHALRIIPADLVGRQMILGVNDRSFETGFARSFRVTEYPASSEPDQIMLTWSQDPSTTQTIQWRTNTEVDDGVVSYQEQSLHERLNRPKPQEAIADTKRLVTPRLANDDVVHLHSVSLTGLKPATSYVYTVGCASGSDRSGTHKFTTAPKGSKPFSFVYMGDVQRRFERWSTLLGNAYRQRPDVAFYMLAGDLVNYAMDRDQWDALFAAAGGVMAHRPIVPALGNHEYRGWDAENLYLDLFVLPDDGPVGERAYRFEYGNALFLVLDSNLPPETQSAWLEAQLKKTEATWKFAIYHHPAYKSTPNRGERTWLLDTWGPIFDEYHLDMVFTGHDHTYLRTHPMRGGKRVSSPAEGTIYVVAVAGTRGPTELGDYDYKAFGVGNVQTYQVIDIQTNGDEDRLLYRAYDIDGNLVDTMKILKPGGQ